MDNHFNNAIFQICRTCMKEVTDASFLYLDCTPAANTHGTIRQKLYSCIPELDLSIVSNPVLCSKCVDILLSAYEFKKNCLQSEIQINKYIQQVQNTGDLNLLEVVRFHQSDIKNLDIEVEMEDFKNDDLVCDISTLNDASECTESTEPEYLLKLEMVDREHVLFNTLFEDYDTNHNLSAAEENSETHNGNVVQNCLSEVIEHEDNNYSKNLNKTNAYYQCYKCGHKAENKLKLILHLRRHTQKKLHFREVISKRFSRYHANLVCYYRCSLCNYLTKYKCLFGFHNRIHLTKQYYKHIFKQTDVLTKAFYTTTKVNKTDIKGNERKCVKNGKYYDKHSFKNQNKSKKSKHHFSHRNSIKSNMRASIVEKVFKCSICEYQCNCKVNLKQHMGIHTGEKPFSCSVCEYNSSHQCLLKQHMQNHAGKKSFSCSICGYQCSQREHLKRHMLTHTGEKPFSCSVCEYRCSRKESLKPHMLTHTREKPFSCSICEYQCGQKSRLKQHMRVHTGEKPFSCSVCEYKSSQKCMLKQHMQNHTGKKPFSCSICGYQCSRKSDLNKHIQIHTGERPFSCSFCEYRCTRKEHLKRHMLTHTREKPFSCFVCNYQCGRKGNLKRHMIIHKEKKAFLCSVCKYQCKQKNSLLLHMQIHTGEKLFRCYNCKYQCNQKGNLKRHMQTHTREKQF